MFEKHKKDKKFQLADLGPILELTMAIIVFIAIICAIIALWEPFLHYLEHKHESGAFLEFLGLIFSIVIGIEFFKLLCEPSRDTLLEVLMFVIARHMIIEETSALENLLSILTIAILFFIDRYLLAPPSDGESRIGKINKFKSKQSDPASSHPVSSDSDEISS